MALGFLKLVPDPLTFDHNPIALLLHMVQQESINQLMRTWKNYDNN